jgi:uncharacterized protein (DUF4415 family)
MTKVRRLKPFTDEDEARVQAEIADDPEAPEATDEQLAQALPFAEAMRRYVGRPRIANPKQQVSVRLDADVLAKLKASGRGWQGRMNAALRKELGLKSPRS